MNKLRLYEHFACAYGTLWFIMLLASLISQSHIDTGEFGMFGFPIIALIYAFFRWRSEKDKFEYRESKLRELENKVNNLEQKMKH